MTQSPPLIGVTTHPVAASDREELDLLLGWIIQAVEYAGGLALPIPLSLEGEALRAFYDWLDGVLFSGGGDIDPARYGNEMTEAVGGVDSRRDSVELSLAQWVAADNKPFFGICRGAQLINVALGGTLYRDTAEHPGAQRHAYYPDLPYDLLAHPVEVAEDSLLAQVLNAPSLQVNSLHHQAVRRLAPALRAAGSAPDGIVEAIEMPGHPFGLAVQWHPECLPRAPETQRLFAAFVAAAQ